MKQDKPSKSAELVALLRAAESIKPADERICYDPFAKDFLSSKYVFLLWLSKCRLLRKIINKYPERIAPGTFGCLAGRTRYIDDYLKICIDDGIEQLVILGAGYDTRAYRFGELRGQVKVFEVDYPTTLKNKVEKVKKIFGSLLEHVVYVPINFEKEKLDERLFESGYDRNLKTLFIWEGVTMYLTAEAVDETLDFVVKNSGNGSLIISNYIPKSVLDGTCDQEYATKIRKAHEMEEPFRFGIEDGAIEAFLCNRGFSQVKNVTGEFFKRTYFKGINETRKVCSLCGFATATVDVKSRT